MKEEQLLYESLKRQLEALGRIKTDWRVSWLRGQVSIDGMDEETGRSMLEMIKTRWHDATLESRFTVTSEWRGTE